MNKRKGIRKVVTGGKIEQVFEIKETERGKEVVAVETFDKDEGVKKREPKRNS